MHIYLDNIIYSKVKNGGVSNYWFELSKYLLEKKDVDLHFFEDSKGEFNFHRKALQIPKSSIISSERSIELLNRLLPIDYKSDAKFIYHSSYFRALKGSKNQIEVSTVYDFIHNYYSSFLKRKIHNNLKFNAIRRSKGIICISNNTYKDLLKFCPPKANQKVEMIYVGVSDDYFPILSLNSTEEQFLESHELENDFLLFVGGRTNYKNFDFAISILNDNPNRKLVVVGGGSITETERGKFSKEALSALVFIPSVSNSELNILFNNAHALLYPSSYEGFGIPVVEAMRAGCPVIGLNNATLQEVGNDSAILLENLDVTDFKNRTDLLFNSDFRSEIIEKGLANSKKYSWEKCNSETFEFYKSLY